ncbi:MAG: DUF3471 domain-containing protein, partial [Blastocatellia bacterium]|nr:DUF3471 domain-containing protein [Blastocatellia bacterium]
SAARKEVKIDPGAIEKYLGKYEIEPGRVITISREGEKFFFQSTGDPKTELFAQSEKEFFLKLRDVDVIFVTDDKGEVTGLERVAGGFRLLAKKLK